MTAGSKVGTVPSPPPATVAPLILVEWRGPVVILTLNNPPLNVLTTPLLDELEARVRELTQDRRVRAMVITGSGDRAFSGGANVREMLPMTRAVATRHSAKGQALYDLLEHAPFPVIAAVRGFCVGGGCEMVQACDFIIAGEDAFFGQPEINIGVIPGWGGSVRLTRTVGAVRARRWIMTGDKVGAAQALQDGFLDKIVPAPEVVAAAVELGYCPRPEVGRSHRGRQISRQPRGRPRPRRGARVRADAVGPPVRDPGATGGDARVHRETAGRVYGGTGLPSGTASISVGLGVASQGETPEEASPRSEAPAEGPLPLERHRPTTGSGVGGEPRTFGPP